MLSKIFNVDIIFTANIVLNNMFDIKWKVSVISIS